MWWSWISKVEHLSAKNHPVAFRRKNGFWQDGDGREWVLYISRNWGLIWSEEKKRKKMLHFVWGIGDWDQFLLFVCIKVWWISEGLLNIWAEIMKFMCWASQGTHGKIIILLQSCLTTKERKMIQILINHHRRSRWSTFLPSINWLNEWGRSHAFLEASVKGHCWDREPVLMSHCFPSLRQIVHS